MKHIYFVRHGETETNAKKLHFSSPTDPLTQKGQEQARFMAERCSRLPLEALISSTFTRAKQTADAISQKTGLSPIDSDLFIECKFASKYWSKDRADVEALADLELIWKNWGVSDYRIADEENYEDIVERSDKALAFLVQRPEEHIGVVTHGLFLNNLIARALFGKSFTPEVSTTISISMETINTGLTIVRYDKDRVDRPWTLWVWNDHAHLAD
ncbi:hypothetical protein A2943_02975 [Candidatus Adlerbacteria bacterium RIFCSPLOWO2_01_FULL_51_16]|uniref:Phosphoglycerate mutase n=1 Tax=Candidatus Adlerbacteria bacterium RIFCSPLOWO2_01_FULL_51_16 TaxID=1797243 RepID=A0A1F4XGQ1_9BACT|nr:MAG: hypothetical protein A2943_02975 [Candidatus Adlerbacteria bacterium RIFCSPLOWO2_01_FULL_51_16]